ncbi:MAG: hypothetical protein AAB740_01600 [Patescibacteria group bacterium]
MKKLIKPKVLAVDFDGVIHKYSKGWMDGVIYDTPMPGALETMAELTKQGFGIIIHTTRLNPEIRSSDEAKQQTQTINQWLKENGFEKGKHYQAVTALKPKASYYIDDRAIKFTDWQKIQKFFMPK